MKLFFLILTALVAPARIFAQEARPPDEKWEFEVEASSLTSISAAIDSKGRVCVWHDAREQHVDPKAPVFSAKQFQIYERGGRLIKSTRNLQDIPRRKFVVVRRPDFSDGIEWMPSGGVMRDNKITFKNMKKIGFVKDEFILGPFEYTIVWSRPIGLDKAGFMYVTAECLKPKIEKPQGQKDHRALLMLYKINRDGQIVDNFIVDEAKYAGITERGARNPWAWNRKGPVYVDENGNIYTVEMGLSSRAGQRKIAIERWKAK